MLNIYLKIGRNAGKGLNIYVIFNIHITNSEETVQICLLNLNCTFGLFDSPLKRIAFSENVKCFILSLLGVDSNWFCFIFLRSCYQQFLVFLTNLYIMHILKSLIILFKSIRYIPFYMLTYCTTFLVISFICSNTHQLTVIRSP